MLIPDFTKKDFIPAGVIVAQVPTSTLKANDRVVVLGEIFNVVYNNYNEYSETYLIRMNHESDEDTFISEEYLHIDRKVKMSNKIIDAG